MYLWETMALKFYFKSDEVQLEEFSEGSNKL